MMTVSLDRAIHRKDGSVLHYTVREPGNAQVVTRHEREGYQCWNHGEGDPGTECRHVLAVQQFRGELG